VAAKKMISDKQLKKNLERRNTLRVLDMQEHDIWPKHIRDVALNNGGKVEISPYLIMKTVDDKIVMGWLASQTDMLADDWYIV
jgi:hypothetical protein